MIIEVDIKYLTECRISVHQYVILKLAYEGKLKLLERYLIASGTLQELPKDLAYLHANEFVKNPPDLTAILNTIRVSEKFTRVFQSQIDSFEEFYNAFPVRVLRPDGSYDYLRVDHKRSKLLYDNTVGTDASKHLLLMKCLKLEVADKTRKGKLSFMKRMPMWLSSEEWRVYADQDLGDLVSTTGELRVGYGQNME
jgi:hypothetical protein